MDPRPESGAAGGSRGAALPRRTDRARSRLRYAQLALAGLAVVIAVPLGAAVREDAPDPASPATGTGAPTEVRAELLAPATGSDLGMVVDAEVPTPARWSAPDGGERTGLLWVGPGLDRGAVLAVWVDADGEQADPPSDVPAGATGVLAGLSTVLACWAGLAVLGVAVRRRLAAVDDRRWAAEWARVEPLWRGGVL